MRFAQARSALGNSPGLQRARETYDAAEQRLGEPMRVALVGRISSGKSTLANALLGARVAATGAQELTFNVSWMYHAPEPVLTVHFKDGRPPQRRDPAELAGLTVRDTTHRQFLAAVDYLRLGLPNPGLTGYDLIDTPGLDSVFGVDSENTLRLLGRTGQQVRESTVQHASGADAVVLVFCRGLASGDAELLADFQGAGFGAATPITAVGALTKVELMWPEHDDPLAAGARLAERMMEQAGARRMLYDLLPVASLVASGAATLTEDETADLLELAGVEPATLTKRLRYHARFRTTAYDDIPLPPQQRARLLDRLGQYGVHLTCTLIRDGVTDHAALQRQLTERSGLTTFQTLLRRHFGNRAELIKLRQSIDDLLRLPTRLGPGLDPRDRHALDEATGQVRRLELNEHAFAELTVLRAHYDGTLTFAETEVTELLRITGEHGTTPADRLGLPPDADTTQLHARAQQRLTHWATVTADPTFAGSTRRAAQVLRRSYELLLTQIPSKC